METKDTSLSTRFLDAYNELDDYMKKILDVKRHDSHSNMLYKLKKNNLFKIHYEDFKSYAELRNAIVHEWNAEHNPIAEPHLFIVERYERLVKEVKNPKNSLHISTKIQKIEYLKLTDSVIDAIEIMHQKKYSYMPVMEDDTIIGIFSENSLFTYLYHKKALKIDRDDTIADFAECIKLDNHMSERFEFVARDLPAVDVASMFSKDVVNDKRLGAVFVTHNGKPDEKILGMISSWDIIDFVDELVL